MYKALVSIPSIATKEVYSQFNPQHLMIKLGVVVYTCNSRVWEGEAERSGEVKASLGFTKLH